MSSKQQYKIRVIHGDRIDVFCFNFGKKPYPSKNYDRRAVLFPSFEAASDKARKLISQFPDTVYQVVTAETSIPILPLAPVPN